MKHSQQRSKTHCFKMIGEAYDPCGLIIFFVRGRFFRYLLLLFVMHQMAVALFRFIGAVGRSMVIANTFGSFALIVVFLLGGFILSKRKFYPCG